MKQRESTMSDADAIAVARSEFIEAFNRRDMDAMSKAVLEGTTLNRCRRSTRCALAKRVDAPPRATIR